MPQFAETYDEAYDHIHEAADGQLDDTQLATQRWLRFLYESITLGTLVHLLSERSTDAVLEAIPFEAFQQGLQQSLVTNLTEVVDHAGTLGLQRPPVSGAYSGLRFDVTNEEAVHWIEQHAANQVTQITQETRLAIRGIVQGSFTEQYTHVESAKRIKEVIGVTQRQADAISRYADGLKAAGHKPATVDRLRKQYHEKSLRYRAESIARTETINASVAGQQQLWEQAIRAGNINRNEWIQEWIVTQDDRTCPRCIVMAGKRARVGETFPGDGSGPTLHTRCVPAGVMVEGPGVVASTDRWYVGDLVELETRFGHRLAVTPNHPILTTKGWVGAGSLDVGNQVISHNRQQRIPLRDPDDRQVPALIEEIARAVDHDLRMLTRGVPVTSEDFHGDGIHGQIAVIRSQRRLMGNRQSSFAQPASHNPFGLCDAHLAALSPLGHVALGVEVPMRTTDRFMRSAGVGTMLFGSTLVGHESVGSGQVTDLDFMFSEEPAESLTTDALALRQYLLRFPSQVTTDEIVSVRRYPFSGHVYNLETSDGWYSANGIITHNCRCAVVLRRITTEPYKLDLPEPKRKAGTLAPKAPALAA